MKESPLTRGETVLASSSENSKGQMTMKRPYAIRFIWRGDLRSQGWPPTLYACHCIAGMQRLAHVYFCQLFLACSSWLTLFLSVIYLACSSWFMLVLSACNGWLLMLLLFQTMVGCQCKATAPYSKLAIQQQYIHLLTFFWITSHSQGNDGISGNIYICKLYFRCTVFFVKPLMM